MTYRWMEAILALSLRERPGRCSPLTMEFSENFLECCEVMWAVATFGPSVRKTRPVEPSGACYCGNIENFRKSP